MSKMILTSDFGWVKDGNEPAAFIKADEMPKDLEYCFSACSGKVSGNLLPCAALFNE